MKWIDQQLKARDISRVRLAEAIPGMTGTKLSLVMSGKRKLSATEADDIRRFFGYRMPDDPPNTAFDHVQDQLSRLREDQIRAVALYLEALQGTSSGQQRAS